MTPQTELSLSSLDIVIIAIIVINVININIIIIIFCQIIVINIRRPSCSACGRKNDRYEHSE